MNPNYISEYCLRFIAQSACSPPPQPNNKTQRTSQNSWLLLCIGAFRQQHTIDKTEKADLQDLLKTLFTLF